MEDRNYFLWLTEEEGWRSSSERRGFSTGISKAERYTFEEAMEACKESGLTNYGSPRMLPVDTAMAFAVVSHLLLVDLKKGPKGVSYKNRA